MCEEGGLACQARSVTETVGQACLIGQGDTPARQDPSRPTRCCAELHKDQKSRRMEAIPRERFLLGKERKRNSWSAHFTSRFYYLEFANNSSTHGTPTESSAARATCHAWWPWHHGGRPPALPGAAWCRRKARASISWQRQPAAEPRDSHGAKSAVTFPVALLFRPRPSVTSKACGHVCRLWSRLRPALTL